MVARSAWATALLALLAQGGCREGDLCVRTIQATCVCDDPFMSSDTCTASAEVAGCQLDGPKPDPCQINPCCQLARDGGSDAALPRDAGPDLGPPDAQQAGAEEDAASLDDATAGP